MDLTMILLLVQMFFGIVIGLYFWNLLRSQKTNRSAVDRESRKELDKLRKLRSISLTKPLAERTRPATLQDIVGQKDGLRALKAALCSANPQHVIIYGPPGVGRRLLHAWCWKRRRRICHPRSREMPNSRRLMPRRPALTSAVLRTR